MDPLLDDEQMRKDVFGPGYLSDDLSQSTVDRIIQRIQPYLTPKWLRIDQLIPVLEKRNFIQRDSLSFLKDSKDQILMLTEIVQDNRTSYFLFSLYASLVYSGHTVYLHYSLANEIKAIIQSECGIDRSVGLVKKTIQSQSTVVNHSLSSTKSGSEAAVATNSPNNIRELSVGSDGYQSSGIFCSQPNEGTHTPNPTEDASDSTLPPAVENTLPSVPKDTSSNTLFSQLNDLGPSSSVCQNSCNNASVVPSQIQFSAASVVPPQNQFSAPLVDVSPSEFCDPGLLEAFNEPNVLNLFSCLVKTGAAINLPTHEGSYLLHLAASRGMDEKVKLLLDNGANSNVIRATDGKTPLHLACEKQSIGCVKCLIECGADVNALDHNEMSCLHSTNTLQEPEIVDLLLHHGAHCDIPTKIDNRTPLAIAAGLSSNTVKQSISYLLKAGASVNGVNQTERPLVAAAFTGTMETVKELINNGANVNIRNKDGMTPLIAAVQTNKKQIVQLLLDRGAYLNCIRSGSYTISGNIVLMSGTALCEAAYNGQLDLVKMLRENGALITAKSQEQKAPIVFAVIGGHANVVDYICTGTKLPDSELLEAFVTALVHGHNDCAVSVFMKSGGLKDKMMEEARRHGSREIMELLSMDLNVCHRQRMIEILLEFVQICLKAALDYKGREWLIDHARKKNQPQMAQFFCEDYTFDGTVMSWYGLLTDFFRGDPSTLNFLISQGIISKTRVEEVLNQMGRNHREFFTDLMKAFHQIPGTDHLPYDGNLLATKLFNGTIVIAHHYKSSCIPSELLEHRPTTAKFGESMLGGSVPPPIAQDSQLTSQPNSQQNDRPCYQQLNQLNSQKAAHQEETSQQSTQITESILDTPCNENIILQIALLSFDWRSVGRRLGSKNVTDIEHEAHDELSRREQMLLKWMQQKGSKATYKCLVEVLETIGNKATAEEVTKLVTREINPCQMLIPTPKQENDSNGTTSLKSIRQPFNNGESFPSQSSPPKHKNDPNESTQRKSENIEASKSVPSQRPPPKQNNDSNGSTPLKRENFGTSKSVPSQKSTLKHKNDSNGSTPQRSENLGASEGIPNQISPPSPMPEKDFNGGAPPKSEHPKVLPAANAKSVPSQPPPSKKRNDLNGNTHQRSENLGASVNIQSQSPPPKQKYDSNGSTLLKSEGVPNQTLPLSCTSDWSKLPDGHTIESCDLTIGDHIASGSFGVVHKGLYSKNPVAIKIISIENELVEKAVKNEASILSKLKHPNIVALIGICKNVEQYLLVMNFIDGFNLDTVIFKEALKLQPSHVKSISLQIVQALKYMHTRDPIVIHQDIKPANVMVTRDYFVYVCDLGVAKLQLHTIKTSKGPGAGTVAYKAPEMFSEDKRTIKVDIYSFGCLLIELSSKTRVWEHLDSMQIMGKVCGTYKVPPTSPEVSHIPQVYQEICAQCTALEPSERPSAQDLLSKLEGIPV